MSQGRINLNTSNTPMQQDVTSQAPLNHSSYNGHESVSQVNNLEKKEEMGGTTNQIGGKQRGSNIIED